jgi:hypothetical protein
LHIAGQIGEIELVGFVDAKELNELLEFANVVCVDIEEVNQIVFDDGVDRFFDFERVAFRCTFSEYCCILFRAHLSLLFLLFAIQNNIWL